MNVQPSRRAALAGTPRHTLIELCLRFLSVEAEYRRLSILADVSPATPGREQADAAVDAVSEVYRDLLDEIAEAPARTPEELAAKAQAISAFYRSDDGTYSTFRGDYPIQRAMWSLVEDVAGRA